MRISCFILVLVLLGCSLNLFSQEEMTWKEHYKMAEKRFTKKKFRGAINEYNKAEALLPKGDLDFDIQMDLWHLYINRGISKWKDKDPTGAMEDLNAAIDLKPKVPEAYYQRGILKYELKDFRGAIEDFDLVIEEYVSYSKAYLQRGLAKIALQDRDGGCLDLSKAGELGMSQAYDYIREKCK